MRFLLSYYSNLVYTNNPFSNNEFNEFLRVVSNYSNLVYTNNPFSNNEFDELNELLRVVIRLIRLIRCFYPKLVIRYTILVLTTDSALWYIALSTPGGSPAVFRQPFSPCFAKDSERCKTIHIGCNRLIASHLW